MPDPTKAEIDAQVENFLLRLNAALADTEHPPGSTSALILETLCFMLSPPTPSSESPNG